MLKVAVLGATGAVGREMIEDLAASAYADKIELKLFASPRSAGQTVTFRSKPLKVQPFKLEDLKGCAFALSSISGSFSREWGERIAEQGTILIDNSSAFRMHPKIPLVVPEINFTAFNPKDPAFPKIIANPNCSTVPLVMALKPLIEACGVKRVFVATYQSTSGAGQKGMEELAQQTTASLRQETLPPKIFKQPVAFNIIPAIDVMDDAGHCFEEEKVVRESRKILGIPNLEVMVTTARVPTLNCHCEAVTVELEKSVTRKQVIELMQKVKYLEVNVSNDPSEFSSNYHHHGKRGVAIGRIRLPLEKTESNFVQFWLVVDNLKKGAATNAVEIFEKLYPLFSE